MFDLQETWVVEEIKRRGAKHVALQLPEGLKPYAVRLAKVIQQETSCSVTVLADPCYGACDVAWEEASRLGVDLLVHFGHSELLASRDIDTLYVECPAKVEIAEVIRAAAPLLRGHRIGLCTILQHLSSMSEAANVLEDMGFEVHVAHPARHGLKPGQIIGCDYSSGKKLVGEVDSLLFLGGGLMHPVGLRLSTGLPVLAIDPWTKEVRDIEPHAKKVVARKLLDMASSSEAERFGIVVGLKPGQHRPKLAERTMKELEKRGKECILIACREFSPSLEAHFTEVEVFVVTSCPLIALFDREAFHKPLLTPSELKASLTGEWRNRYPDPFDFF